MKNLILGSIVFYILTKSFIGWSMEITSVNGGPKLASDHKNFATYWGLWLKLDEEEKQNTSFVITKRSTNIKTWKCSNSKIELDASEEFYLFDKIYLNQQGEVTPIREAYRPGYRYFSVANIAGLFIRGQKKLGRIKRISGESYQDYNKRTIKLREAWRLAANPKGAYGEVGVNLDFKSYQGDQSSASKEESFFLKIEDYRSKDSKYYDMFVPFAPGNWPIHYDERAHKPHHILQPEVWNSQEYSQIKFNFTIKWNWCGDELNLVIETLDKVPAPGPNRSGRTSSAGTIKIIKID